jgi:hypothetical protein
MLLMELPPPHPLERIDSTAVRTVKQKDAILFVGNIGNSLPGWALGCTRKRHYFITIRGLTL